MELEQQTLIIVPPAEELSAICNSLKCTEEGCTSTFSSSSNLNMHLIKHHKIKKNSLDKKRNNTFYHCPATNCDFSVGLKHFSKLKYLKQHFLKIHAEKIIKCEKCDKCFSTVSAMKLHLKVCGIIFTCSCGWTYNSMEALQTHCKRKGHTLNKLPPIKTNYPVKTQIQINSTTENRPIYPKPSVQYIAAIALIELSGKTTKNTMEKEIQTDSYEEEKNKTSKKHNPKNERKRVKCQQTQTGGVGRSRKVKISTETQTNSDYAKNMKNKFQSNKISPRKRKMSMETQTNKTKSEVTKLKPERSSSKKPANHIGTILEPAAKHFKEPEYLDNPISKLEHEMFDDSNSMSGIKTRKTDVASDVTLLQTILDEDSMKNWCFGENSSLFKKDVKNNREFVTTINNENFSQNKELSLFDSRDTEQSLKDRTLFVDHSVSNLFDIHKFSNIETQTELDSFLNECNEDTSFTLCSTTETQTTDDFDPIYSNTCTQTCDEVDLFNFNFVDIETQTAWPD